MSDVEVLGRSLYRPVKHRLKEDRKPLNQIKSKEPKPSSPNADLVYERDEKDSLWREDS